MTVGTFVGSMIPLLMNKLNIDPAVASGPFITTINDIISMLIYFGLATSFMAYLNLRRSYGVFIFSYCCFSSVFLNSRIVNRLNINFLPVVVAEILMGIVIGNSFLNIVERDSILNILSTLGFIFLMFLSGLEIDFKAFKKINAHVKDKMMMVLLIPGHLNLALTVFAFIMIISILLAYVFKWLGLVDDVLLMVIIISTISLGVVVPTLKEMNIMRTTIGQFILLETLTLVTMILLTVYGAINGQGGSTIWLIGILVVFTAISYILGVQFKRMSFLQKLMDGTTQIGIWCICINNIISSPSRGSWHRKYITVHS